MPRDAFVNGDVKIGVLSKVQFFLFIPCSGSLCAMLFVRLDRRCFTLLSVEKAYLASFQSIIRWEVLQLVDAHINQS